MQFTQVIRQLWPLEEGNPSARTRSNQERHQPGGDLGVAGDRGEADRLALAFQLGDVVIDRGEIGGVRAVKSASAHWNRIGQARPPALMFGGSVQPP